jgi:hypothetical protein
MWKSFTLGLLASALAGASGGQPAPPAREGTPLAAAPEAPPLRVRQVYRVKQQGGGLGVFVDEAAVFHEVGQGPARVWVVERRRRDDRLGKVSFRYDWVDGRQCPALEGVVAAIGRLPPTAMAGLDTEPQGWISDLSVVTLMGPPKGGRAGDLVLRRDLAGPVSRWWSDGAKLLEPCWQTQKPYVAGAYDLRSQLETAESEAEAMRPY